MTGAEREAPEVLDYEPHHWPYVDAFWARTLGRDWDDRARSRWHWLESRRAHCIALGEGRLLGNATLLRQQFVSPAGDPIPVRWVTDLWVSPEEGGRGLGRSLVRGLAEAGGVPAAFGHSEAARRCVGGLGWTDPTWIPLVARVLPQRTLRLHHPFAMRRVGFGDPTLDAVWQRRGARDLALAVRDTDTLRARFEGRPDARYEAWLAEQAGEPRGWVALRAIRGGRNRMFGRLPVGLVVDLLAVDDRHDVLSGLLRFALRRLGRMGALAALAVEPPGATGRALRDAGFTPDLRLGPLRLRDLPPKGFMVAPPGKELFASTPHLAFADGDAELTL